MNKVVIYAGNELPTHNTGGYRKVLGLFISELKGKGDIGVEINYHYKELIYPYEKLTSNESVKGIQKVAKNFIPQYLRLFLRLNYNKFFLERALNNFLKSQNEIIIHSHINIGIESILRNRKKFKVKRVISTYHSKGSLSSDWQDQWGFRTIRWFKNYLRNRELLVAKNSDVLTFPSKGAFELFKNEFKEIDFTKKRVEIIYNGIDIEKIQEKLSLKIPISFDLEKDKFHIINVSEHTSFKRVEYALDVLAEFGKSHDFVFHQIGVGALLDKNREHAQKLGIAGKVKFYGALDNVSLIQLMSKCHVYFMPSVNVVFDLITLEAMSLGKPVVLTADGGNLEIIENGKNGFIFMSDDFEGYLKSLINLAEDNELSSTVSQNSKKTIEEGFSAKIMTERYLNLYTQI